eukprot:scaffold7736_cov20-Tisochrysis_lutea.AAC.1
MAVSCRLAAASRPKRRAVGRATRGSRQKGKPGTTGVLVLLGPDGLPLPPPPYMLAQASAAEEAQVRTTAAFCGIHGGSTGGNTEALLPWAAMVDPVPRHMCHLETRAALGPDGLPRRKRGQHKGRARYGARWRSITEARKHAAAAAAGACRQNLLHRVYMCVWGGGPLGTSPSGPQGLVSLQKGSACDKLGYCTTQCTCSHGAPACVGAGESEGDGHGVEGGREGLTDEETTRKE